jgi:phage gp29-like protein
MQKQGVERTIGWQPTGADEEITTINANASGEFEKMNMALNETIQRVVLGQTLTSSIGKGGGSYAAAKVQNEVRDDKRRADVRMIVRTIQSLVDALWELNAFTGDPPRFELQDDVGLEKDRADRDAILADKLGVRFTPDYFTERYDLNEDDFTIVDPKPAVAPPIAAPPNGADAPALSALLSGSPRFTPEQQVIERGIAEVLGNLPSVIADAEIKAAIRLATSPQDLHERLLVILDGAESPEFQRTFEKALFVADVLGYAHAATKPAG